MCGSVCAATPEGSDFKKLLTESFRNEARSPKGPLLREHQGVSGSEEIQVQQL
jgi:hypothetical protein